MFTGIVEEIGTVEKITHGANSAILTIRAGKVLEGTKTGDSIAVNGICLTVTRIGSGRFYADVMHETLNRSALAALAAAMSTSNAPCRPAAVSAVTSFPATSTA